MTENGEQGATAICTKPSSCSPASRSTGKCRRNQAFLRQPFDGIRLAGGERLEFRLQEGLPDGKQLQHGMLGHVDISQPGLDQLDQSVGGMQLTDEAPHPAFESKDVIGERRTHELAK